jgi:aerotaxis receptor
VDQLFFSTTDPRGVITGANSVFQQLSAFVKGELMGAPHNVIRHPEMPAGVFRLMWDRLDSGRPFAGYVRNLAKDGYTYWVFATVTPVAGGFLSVRSAPCANSPWEAAAKFYDLAVPLERDRRHLGMSRLDAAAAGQRALEDMLHSAGYPSYEEFMFAALPAETTARAAQLAPRLLGAHTPPGGVGDVLRAAVALAGRLDGVLCRLGSLQEVAEALLRSSEDLAGTVDALGDVTCAASRAADQVADRSPVLASTTRAMDGWKRDVARVVGDMSLRLRAVRRAVLGLRFGIALSHLHTHMVIAFAREVLDGYAPAEGLSYVPVLCDALADDVVSLSRQLDGASADLSQTSEEIGACGAQFGQFQKLLATWRLLVPRYGLSQTLGPMVAPIDRQLSDGLDQVGRLRDLARACVEESHTVDTEALLEPINRIAAAVRSLQPL